MKQLVNLPSLNFQVIINFLIYCTSTIFIRSISFFVLPFIMHKISPSEYGSLSLLSAFTVIMTALLGLGLRQLFSIEYFHANNQQRQTIIHDILIMYTAIALPILGLLWHIRITLIHIFFFNTVTSMQLFATFIIIITFFYIELMYQLLQYQQKIKHVTLLQCTVAFVIAGCTLITVFYCDYGITGIIWSQAIGYCIACIMAIIYFFRDHGLRFKYVPFQQIQYYLWYGLPFTPTILANWLLASGDRWILGYFTSMHEVGIYAVADLACQLFYAIVLQSWGASYLPYIMKQYQENSHQLQNIEYENQRIMWISMAGCSITITLGYPLAWMILPKIVPSAYLQAINYLWILLMGQIFLLGSYFAAALIQYHKRTYFLAFALFIPALLNIILNCIMIPLGGIMGCSLATAISYGVYFLITYSYNKRIINS
jgi:O-antigen/teichoic acid export membrane protein